VPQIVDPPSTAHLRPIDRLNKSVTPQLPATDAGQRIGGIASTALMVGVFPANIYTVVKHWQEPKARGIAIARLPLQIPLVWMSLSAASDV
jgi:uncharacterized membrane protein